MKNLIRKWTLALRRRRIKKQVRTLGSHKETELQTREAGIDCNNCGAPLSGPFCHICGQRDDDFKRPFWMLLREILDNVFSADSRLIKTLILLVLVPGGLTRAFIDGRRARFVPPLRLYITVSIVFFVVLEIADVLILDIHVTPSSTSDAAIQKREQALKAAEDVIQQARIPGGEAAGPATVQPVPEEAGPDIMAETTDAATLPEPSPAPPASTLSEAERAKVEAVMRALDKLGVPSPGGDAGAGDLEELRARLRGALDDDQNQMPENVRDMLETMQENWDDQAEEKAPRGPTKVTIGNGDSFNFDLPYDFDVAMFVEDSGEVREGFAQDDIDKILADPDVPPFIKEATRGFARALRQPQQMNRLFNDWLPRALFVLLPVFALILRAFHWGKHRYYLHQIVFSLHFHSFLFLLLTALVIVVPRYGAEQGAMLFWWGTSLYLVIALKVGQNQGIIRSFFKAGFIWVSYFTVMLCVIFGMAFLGLREL